MWLEGVPGERGSDSVEDVSPLSPKKRPHPFLAINFSLEVLSWFIDDSSEETSSSISSTSVVTEELSLLSSSKSYNLFLTAVEDLTSYSTLPLLDERKRSEDERERRGRE
jgi:hypothetical protein